MERTASVLRAPKLSVIGTSEPRSRWERRDYKRENTRSGELDSGPQRRRDHRGFDRRAAQAAVAVVEHDELSRCRRALLLVEPSFERAFVRADHRAGLVGLAVTNLRVAAQRLAALPLARRRPDPMRVRRGDRAALELWMLVALHDDELVACGVLRGHVPRVFGPIRGAADVQAVALTERVIGEAAMPAALHPQVVANDAGVVWQVLAQEFRERPFADEADTRAVLLLGDREAGLARDLAHLALEEVAERHQDVHEVFGRDCVQEVALVLGRIDALAQAGHPVDRVDARVVARRNLRRAEPPRVASHDAELDLPVAEH